MIRLTFCILYFHNVIFVESIVVNTNLGPIKGQVVEDELAGKLFYSFEGIPYAQPPVGELRWEERPYVEPPVRKQAWCNEFDATKPGPVCPQKELFYTKAEMDEDCLNFNIYTSGLNQSLPVLFIIHSGDLYYQSGNAKPIYGSQFYIRNEIVVVTANYRLGALGFLSMNNKKVPGNYGVKDLVLVLKIVKEIISKFGGNPNKITIRGNGGGAALVDLLMLTKQAKGLFHNAMVNSGTILSSKYSQLNPRENAILLAEELGLSFTSDDCLVEQLKKVNALEIVKAQEAISKEDPQRGFYSGRNFKPCVEVEHEGAIITKPPLELLAEGEIVEIPVITGFTNQEGIIILPEKKEDPKITDKLNEDPELLIPKDIPYKKGSEESKNLAKKIKDFYFNGGNISDCDPTHYVNFLSDVLYNYPVDNCMGLFKDKKKSSGYYYVFALDSKLNWFKTFTNTEYPGAGHLDDLGYVFATSATMSQYKNLSCTIKQAQDRLLKYEKSFMYTGAPPPEWPECGRDLHHIVLSNDKTTAVYSRPLPERIGFWKSVYEECRKKTSDSQTKSTGLVASVIKLFGSILGH